jgi:ABC-type multidrug transport system fused ATPase/permease subunit
MARVLGGWNSGRLVGRLRQEMEFNPSWQFTRDIARLIREYWPFSLAILIVTIMQEIIALWPVNLLGQFVDRLESGNLGNVVWLFFGASLLAPAVARGNIILRHKMFYETDFRKRVELTLQACAKGKSDDVEAAGATNTRVANAVSGITNATYYVLGNFTPVIIKVVVVSASLLAYNRVLGLAYVGSLIIPFFLTIFFNKKLQVLRDAQYSVISQSEGAIIKTMTAADSSLYTKFRGIMRERTDISFTLVSKSQIFLYLRHATLIGSQFIVVFIALFLKDKIHLTPGDFTKIIGYTTQVALVFLEFAACFDAIISYSRAYHVYAQGRSK